MGYYRKALSRESAQKILSTAQPIGLSLYFMTDDNVLFSLGRSPIDEPSPSSYGGDKPSTALLPHCCSKSMVVFGKGYYHKVLAFTDILPRTKHRNTEPCTEQNRTE